MNYHLAHSGCRKQGLLQRHARITSIHVTARNLYRMYSEHLDARPWYTKLRDWAKRRWAAWRN